MDETSWGIIAIIFIVVTVFVLIGFYKLCENVDKIRKILENDNNSKSEDQ